MPENRIQCGFVKASVVVDPSAKNGVEHPCDVLQRPVHFQMESPTPNRLSHGLTGLVTHCRREVDEMLVVSILGPSRPKRVSQKIELRFRMFAPSVIILAVNDARLIRVEFETTLPHPSFQMVKNAFGLFFCSGLDYSIICVSGPWVPRKSPLHPLVERVMKKKICQNRADNASLRSSCPPFDDRSIFCLEWCRKPSLDVQQNPFAVRMATHCSKQQFVINVVE